MIEFDPVRLRAGLAPIADKRQFCLWRLEQNDGDSKARKVPFIRDGSDLRRLSGGYDDPALPSRLMTLDEALVQFDASAPRFAGVGFAFTPGCGVVGLDLDDVVRPDGARKLTLAQTQALSAVREHAFVEVSVSGTGLHAITLADATTLKANGELEVFGDRNFIALTGEGVGLVRVLPQGAMATVIAGAEAARALRKTPNTRDLLRNRAHEINAEVLEAARSNGTEDPERVRSALFHLDPRDYGYEAWRNMAWAVKDGAGEGGFELFDEWSSGDPEKYQGAEDVRRVWDSDKAPSGGISVATLFRVARDKGWRDAPTTPVAQENDGPGASGDYDGAQPTDLALARLWAKNHGDAFRYDHADRSWLIFDRGRWRACHCGEHMESFKCMAVKLVQLAAETYEREPDSRRAKQLFSCATRAQSASGIKAALELAQSDPRVAITGGEFDRDPDVLNVVNGALHLPTRELRPHGPGLMLRRQSPVEFAANAACPQFMRFMDEITCGDAELIDYIQRTLGYALSGHVGEEKAFLWLGTGANGKSVLANVVRHVLGDYAAIAPSAFLMQSRRDGGSATPELAMLPGVRVLLANEVEAGSRLSGQTLKVAVSTERISARPLYGKPFSFAPTHKLFVRGNHRPIINDDDDGIWRRIDLVPFDLRVPPEERDMDLESRLLQEAPGILRWMVDGYSKWKRDGLHPARRVREASLAYRRDCDVLGQWVDDCCDIGPALVAPQKTAYDSYRVWCREQGLRDMSKKSFTRGLRERGIGERRETTGARKEVYTGLACRHGSPLIHPPLP